jgi:hypothetical protein
LSKALDNFNAAPSIVIFDTKQETYNGTLFSGGRLCAIATCRELLKIRLIQFL